MLPSASRSGLPDKQSAECELCTVEEICCQNGKDMNSGLSDGAYVILVSENANKCLQ